MGKCGYVVAGPHSSEGGRAVGGDISGHLLLVEFLVSNVKHLASIIEFSLPGDHTQGTIVNSLFQMKKLRHPGVAWNLKMVEPKTKTQNQLC